MRSERKWSYLNGSVLLITIISVCLGFIRLRYGLTFSDEGYALSSPLRLVMGDMPFRDEWFNVGRSFDIILCQVMRILPDYGNVLLFRKLDFLFHIVVLVVFCFSFRRHASFSTLCACFMASLYMNVRSFWSPGYTSFLLYFSLLSMSSYIEGYYSVKSAWKMFFGVLSGVFLCLSGISYITSFGAVFAPILIVTLSINDRRMFKNHLYTLIPFGVTLIVLFIAIYMYLQKSALIHDIIFAWNTMREISQYSSLPKSIMSVVLSMFRSMPHALIILGVIAFIYTFLLPSRKMSAGWKAMTYILSFIAATLFVLLSLPMVLKGFVLLGVVFYLFLRKHYGNEDKRELFVLDLMVLWGSFLFFSTGVVSANKELWSSILFTPVFILVAAVIGEKVFNKRAIETLGVSDKVTGKSYVAAILIIVTAVVILKTFRNAPAEGSVFNLTKMYTHRKIHGIYASPERVDHLEELLAFLDGKVHKGDRLLAFYKLDILNYLTDTMSPLNYSIINQIPSTHTVEQTLEYMIESGREPKYAVRQLYEEYYIGNKENYTLMTYPTEPEIDPLFAYVYENYEVITQIGPYEVWERKVNSDGEERGL